MAENKEVEIKGAVKPISLKQTSIILNQMQTCVCRIHNGQKKGTGFFLKIPYQKNDLPVLITNNHVLGEEKIAEGQLITLSLQSLNDEETTINIEIDNGRKRYTNEILDVTIIELNNNDNIKHFLTLDKKVINIISSENKDSTEYFNNIYESISLYILKYVENNILASFGLLQQISQNSIYHKCSTVYGSSGSPIILLETNKVIGVHFGPAKHTPNTNEGTFLVEPIRQFQRMTDNILVIKKPKASNNCSRNNINNNLDSGDSNIKTKSIDNNNNLSQQLTEIESHVFQNDNDKDKHKDTIVLDQNKLKEREIEINPKVDKSKGKKLKVINIKSIEKDHRNNNQISINNDLKKYQERNRDFIKHLIKFIFFKKEIQSKTSLFQKGLTKVYAVNIKIILKLLNIFNINEIIRNLNKNKILDQITYFNFDKSYFKILTFLYDNNININIEEIKLTENERVLAFHKLSDPKNLPYLNDFELIDKSFVDFLKLNIKGITFRQVNFGIINHNKIFLAIEFGEKFFYEIFHLNKELNYIFEYLIKNEKSKFFGEQSALNNLIFGFLCKKPLLNFNNNKRKNEIKLDDNIILNFYQINNAYSKNKKRDNSYKFNETDLNVEDSMNVTRITFIGNKNNEKSKEKKNKIKYYK